MKDIDNKWKFSSITGIEESTFNKVLENFYDYGILGLVRENIQNSLDGKVPNSEGPVKVIIGTEKISKEEVPGLEEIKKIILEIFFLRIQEVLKLLFIS